MHAYAHSRIFEIDAMARKSDILASRIHCGKYLLHKNLKRSAHLAASDNQLRCFSMRASTQAIAYLLRFVISPMIDENDTGVSTYVFDVCLVIGRYRK